MKILRHIIGYTVGITVFAVLIPLGIFYISDIVDGFFGLVRFSDYWVRFVLAIPIFIVGITFVIWSNAFLFFRGKGGPADGFGVAVSPRTEKLVTTGPYRYTRNPMVFGALSTYYSIAIYIGSIGGVLVMVIFSFLARIYLKKVEEPRLLGDFGKEYEKYRGRVAMIVPFILRRGG
jgi:protein-S-isoprenylcysteine O-methyltransferase Ste14